MEQFLEIAIVPLIVTIVYGLVSLIKTTFPSEKLLRFIPIISAVLGSVVAVVMFYAFPSAVESSNVVVSIIKGAISGLSATGAHQIIKQLTKPHINKDDIIDKLTTPPEETDEESETENTDKKDK